MVLLVILVYPQSGYSNYGELQAEENLFDRFKLYINYLKANDLFSLDNIMSQEIPFSEKQDNIDWGMPEKNANYRNAIKRTHTIEMIKRTHTIE